MKKSFFTRIFLIFLLGYSFLQVAVQKNRDKKTFVGSPQDGIDSTLTYTYQGDKSLNANG